MLLDVNFDLVGDAAVIGQRLLIQALSRSMHANHGYSNLLCLFVLLKHAYQQSKNCVHLT